MSIQELEAEVQRLSPRELAAFGKWFEQFATAAGTRDERDRWTEFSAEGLARAYSNSEPEYKSADLKRE
jgi:hypothetical protein